MVRMMHRLANENDFDAVFALYMDEAANPYLTFDPMPENDFRSIYKDLLQTGTLYIADLEGEIAATYRLIPKTNRQAHTWYLGSFTIKNSLQGRGLGLQVLEYIKQFASQNNKRRIELTVDVNNTAAIHLYKKAGFLTEGLVKMSYIRSGTDTYLDEYLMAIVFQ